MKLLKNLILLAGIVMLGGAAFIYFGVFDVGADVPHWPIVHDLMETARQRSVAVRAQDIPVPPLDDPKLVADGAGHYSQMCTGCHLAPGVSDSEIRRGLYPQPPNLSQRVDASPAEMFWTIKHGIKMTAMPAWGTTHDNQAIWAIVAFLQKLPAMSPGQYQTLTHDSAEGQHSHHHHGDDAAATGELEHSDESGHQHATAGDGAPSHEHGDEAAGADEPAAAGADDHEHADGAGDHDQAGKAGDADAPISLDGLKANAVPDAEAVALAFHEALQKGDRAKALALLSPSVTISEAGHTQTRDEYASGHLDEDIVYLKGAQVSTTSFGSMLMGESAIVGGESEIRSTVNGQAKVQRSRELLTLKRENGDWKIVAIRWQ